MLVLLLNNICLHVNGHVVYNCWLNPISTYYIFHETSLSLLPLNGVCSFKRNSSVSFLGPFQSGQIYSLSNFVNNFGHMSSGSSLSTYSSLSPICRLFGDLSAVLTYSLPSFCQHFIRIATFAKFVVFANSLGPS